MCLMRFTATMALCCHIRRSRLAFSTHRSSCEPQSPPSSDHWYLRPNNKVRSATTLGMLYFWIIDANDNQRRKKAQRQQRAWIKVVNDAHRYWKSATIILGRIHLIFGATSK
ncbi:hypothetical protein O6H91_20G016500 [Diphasiastrum complanatum]|uniref:Uncharacterized protein n=1 Tax=Diphasiastrum complanatum TaxID=34168 RepID=A0ACC2AN78_DIPCM|nr:hypothetical protein O6H91_20G016500 [Diphasiastrum complanatum]